MRRSPTGLSSALPTSVSGGSSFVSPGGLPGHRSRTVGSAAQLSSPPRARAVTVTRSRRIGRFLGKGRGGVVVRRRGAEERVETPADKTGKAHDDCTEEDRFRRRSILGALSAVQPTRCGDQHGPRCENDGGGDY